MSAVFDLAPAARCQTIAQNSIESQRRIDSLRRSLSKGRSVFNPVRNLVETVKRITRANLLATSRARRPT